MAPNGKPPLVRRKSSVCAPKVLNELDEKAENNPQFRATRMWNIITRKFCKDVPRKRHRKHLRIYDNTFTGKEAVDFLIVALPNVLEETREVAREQCVLLLEKFLENDIIRHIRSDNALFKDSSELYKLSPAAEEIEESAKQHFVRRASSFSEKNKNKSKLNWQHQKIPANPKISPLPPMTIPTSPPKLGASRRLSMSHGNLSTLHDHHHDSGHFHNSSLKIPKDLSFITENIVSPPECEPSTSQFPLPRPPPVVRTEIDLNEVWKYCLLNQLEHLLGNSSIRDALKDRFDGIDVKWNAEHVGKRGIVKARNEDGDFPTFLMKMMRYVARYPFDQSPEISKVSYRGIEVDTFGNICQEISKCDQLLPNHTAEVLLQIVSAFMKRIPQSEVDKDSYNDVFAEENENTPSRGTFIRSRPLRSSFNALTEKNQEHCTTPISRLRYNGKTCLNLPGLKEGPELIKRIEELNQESVSLSSGAEFTLSQSSMAIPRSPYKAPGVMESALVRGIRVNDVDDLITAMSLVLLTLPTTTRRRLHFVFRFMQRVSANNCLRLQDYKENRYVVLERLASCIIRPSTPHYVPPAQALLLVTFLMDHESRVFSVPELLYKSVSDLTSPKKNSTPTSIVSQSSAPSISPDKQFCSVIDRNSYDSQRKDESNIRELLDQICGDTQFTDEQRKKCLRNFKQTYPEIYKERFPVSPSSSSNERRTPLPIPRFLNKLMNMKFRD